MSKRRAGGAQSSAAGGRRLFSHALVVILLISAYEVRKGSRYLDAVKDVLSPIREALANAVDSGDRDLKEGVAGGDDNTEKFSFENQVIASKIATKDTPSTSTAAEAQDEMHARPVTPSHGPPEKEEDESQPTKLDKNTSPRPRPRNTHMNPSISFFSTAMTGVTTL
jgi:hypothetical protein